MSGSPRHFSWSDGHLVSSGITIDDVADVLSGKVEVGQRVVLNRTGRAGNYDFKLGCAPDHGQGIAPDATGPGLVDALREQLGLRLVKAEDEMPVVMVQSIQRPEFD